jgi:hypothetical protein
MQMAITATEQSRIGSISQPPDFIISNTFSMPPRLRRVAEWVVKVANNTTARGGG